MTRVPEATRRERRGADRAPRGALLERRGLARGTESDGRRTCGRNRRRSSRPRRRPSKGAWRSRLERRRPPRRSLVEVAPFAGLGGRVTPTSADSISTWACDAPGTARSARVALPVCVATVVRPGPAARQCRGEIWLTLRRQWADRTTHQRFDPLELLERFAY